MKEKFTILIADRNRNIREFLQREMTAEGYHVYLAKNGCEVLKIIDFVHPDILVLDPDIPYLDGLEILDQLQHENMSIPVFLHAFYKENEDYTGIHKVTAFVEKNGNSVNQLKALIADTLKKHYPRRFSRIYSMMSIK
ncbi:MAG: response regulator [bacterium]